MVVSIGDLNCVIIFQLGLKRRKGFKFLRQCKPLGEKVIVGVDHWGWGSAKYRAMAGFSAELVLYSACRLPRNERFCLDTTSSSKPAYPSNDRPSSRVNMSQRPHIVTRWPTVPEAKHSANCATRSHTQHTHTHSHTHTYMVTCWRAASKAIQIANSVTGSHTHTTHTHTQTRTCIYGCVLEW